MKHVWRSRSGRIGVIIVATAVAVALISLVWTPHDPRKVVPSDRWLPISAAHWFGTDGAGKDLFSQVLVGARTTLFVVVASVVVGCVTASSSQPGPSRRGWGQQPSSGVVGSAA